MRETHGVTKHHKHSLFPGKQSSEYLWICIKWTDCLLNTGYFSVNLNLTCILQPFTGSLTLANSRKTSTTDVKPSCNVNKTLHYANAKLTCSEPESLICDPMQSRITLLLLLPLLLFQTAHYRSPVFVYRTNMYM